MKTKRVVAMLALLVLCVVPVYADDDDYYDDDDVSFSVGGRTLTDTGQQHNMVRPGSAMNPGAGRRTTMEIGSTHSGMDGSGFRVMNTIQDALFGRTATTQSVGPQRHRMDTITRVDT
jgi:hypothetical protein